MASNFVARSFGGVARPKIVEAKPKAVALRKAPSSGLPPIISEKARLGALLAGEAESAARMQTQVKALQLQIAPAVQSERTATGGKPVPAGKLEAWLREAAARFDHVASLSVQPSREARRAQLIAEVGPRPASFDDSIAIHSFKPKLRLGSSSKTAVFDRALSEAIAGYRPEQDLGLQRAGGASLETRGVTLASLPGAGRYPVRASAVASRIAGVNLSEHLRALLMQAAGSAAGPAGEPLLRPVQALASAIVLSAARAPVKAHLERTLAAAQNEVEQALIIKSIGARAARLMTNDEHNNAAALGEIDAFSTMIRGAPVSLVLDRSSMLVATDSTRFD